LCLDGPNRAALNRDAHERHYQLERDVSLQVQLPTLSLQRPSHYRRGEHCH
jgi:hypothetical protein